MSEYLDKYDRSTNLIQQRVDREDYRHGWKERKGVKMIADTIEKLDSIFDLEELDNEVGELNDMSDVHADQILWKIGALNAQIDSMKKSQQESVEFYNRRMEAMQKQIDRRSSLLEDLIRSKNSLNDSVKTMKVPNGTIRLTSNTKKYFPSDEETIKYCEENKIEGGIKTTRKPVKKAILEYIKNTGIIPEGYEEETIQNFSYKVGG